MPGKHLLVSLHPIFLKFVINHPALLYGLAALFGSLAALSFSWGLWTIFLGLPICGFFFHANRPDFRLPLRFGLMLMLSVLCYASVISRYQLPKDDKSTGMATLNFSSVSLTKTHFGKVWKYQGTLKTLYSFDGVLIAKNLPIKMCLSYDTVMQRPRVDEGYHLKSILRKKNGTYTLSPFKQAKWESIEKIWNFGEERFKYKLAFQQYIQRVISDKHVAAFLSGVATGQFDDLQLSHELSRFGLQHLMAVSGLHFSFLASFLSFILCLFFRRSMMTFFLTCFLSLYFLFLGYSSSIIRAWVSIMMALNSSFVQRPSLPLNSLGVGILMIVLWDPFLVKSMAFHFTFGVTASILIWYTPCDALVKQLFRQRNLGEVFEIGWFEQHAYCLLVFFRKMLALTLAVNLTALPLTLYHFHKFPVMSLLYNLFFPALISLSLILLLSALLLIPISAWLSLKIHFLNESFTRFVLNFAFGLPKAFDLTLYIHSFSENLLLLYFTFIFLLGILVKELLIDQNSFSPSNPLAL